MFCHTYMKKLYSLIKFSLGLHSLSPPLFLFPLPLFFSPLLNILYKEKAKSLRAFSYTTIAIPSKNVPVVQGYGTTSMPTRGQIVSMKTCTSMGSPN